MGNPYIDKLGKRPYISGPMTGYENYNRDVFEKVEKYLKNFHLEPLNPLIESEKLLESNGYNRTDFDKLSYNDYLMNDLMIIEYFATSLVMLPKWQDSYGAFQEYHKGVDANLIIYEFSDLNDLDQMVLCNLPTIKI